jgi:hypothetical protein
MLAGDFTDPIRIWNNTGPVDSSDVAVAQYEPDECGNGELAATFTQINRDYFFSTDSTAAKPGYVKYTYPHPLRSSPSPSQPIPSATSSDPHNLHKTKEKKAEKVKRWKWGKAKENSTN